jgi:hypothetical protein
MKHSYYIYKVIFALTITTFAFCIPAYSQIDYFFGRRTKGLTIAAGGGVSWLNDKYDVNPLKPALTGNLDYNLNEYLSFGVEGQKGTLYAKNSASNHKQPYSPVTNNYYQANFNIKVSYGLFSKGVSPNGLIDVLKRIYIGPGIGVIKNAVTYVGDAQAAGQADIIQKPYTYALAIPVNLGTSIDLPILSNGKLELNPNYQFDVVNSKFIEGFTSPSHTVRNASFYSLATISLKYRF